MYMLQVGIRKAAAKTCGQHRGRCWGSVPASPTLGTHTFVCAHSYVCVYVLQGEHVVMWEVAFLNFLLGRQQLLSLPPSLTLSHNRVTTDDLGSVSGGSITPWLKWEVGPSICILSGSPKLLVL